MDQVYITGQAQMTALGWAKYFLLAWVNTTTLYETRDNDNKAPLVMTAGMEPNDLSYGALVIHESHDISAVGVPNAITVSGTLQHKNTIANTKILEILHFHSSVTFGISIRT